MGRFGVWPELEQEVLDTKERDPGVEGVADFRRCLSEDEPSGQASL